MALPSYTELFRVFGRIGILSFGGPAAQIALMHKELVEDRPWLQDKQFLSALSFVMLLPGPEAMQLATYAGWRQRGSIGGIIAGLLFVLPGAAVILALALCYVSYGDLPAVKAAFHAVQAAVVVIVLMALRKLAAKALRDGWAYMLAAGAFVAIFFLHLPFPLVILVAATFGAVRFTTAAPLDPRPLPAFPWRPVLNCFGLWAAPLAALAVLDQPFLLTLGLFFSKLAVVTFGGAYAVLAYMTQAVVQDHGWLSLAQMIDALGLAETTPGPLILVTQFVATLAGFSQGGLGLAILAALLTLWVTFLPCFLWIFAGAPYVDHLTHHPRLSGALSGISAAVAGVILNLSLWFALHVLFELITQSRFGPIPHLPSFDVAAAAFMLVAAVLLVGLRASMVVVLMLMAAAGAATTLF